MPIEVNPAHPELVEGRARRSTSSRRTDRMGMTLEEYATSIGKNPVAIRADYSRMMRTGEDIELPEPTKSSEQNGVRKFCLPLTREGENTLETESVIIPMSGHRGNNWHTLCVSSQIGCRMACTFCETGSMGLLMNLTPGEIVAQRMAASRLMPTADSCRPWTYHGDGIDNIVFMGMGEPLDNFDSVIHAIRVLNDPAGLNFPLTQITISTVGRIDGIRRLGELAWKNLRLAVSLNAARDDLRNELMPINKGMPLKELQRALIDYPLPKKGKYMIEYVLMKGVNDSMEDADLVAEWCRPLPCAVNLIPYNPQRDAKYEYSGDDVMLLFMNRLKERGQFVKRRITQGRDLMGACGQLGNPALTRRAA